MRGGHNAYSRDEILDKLQKLHIERQRPITKSMVINCEWMPSPSVFKRLFGSLKNACKEGNVPFERYKGEFYDNRAENIRKSKVGETNINKQGCLMMIVEYHDSRNIIVEFQDEFLHRTKTRYDRFKKGAVKNPFTPTYYGVGVFGNKYPSEVNGKATKEYATWEAMLRRCYVHDERKNMRVYDTVTCCEEWLYFPNFYDWLHAQENFEQWSCDKSSALDKDILTEENKIYSPDTCLLVPACVNALITQNNNNPYPPGVQPASSTTFQVVCCKNSTSVYLGTYKTPEEAFQVYKEYKEKVIKEVADREYAKGSISQKCYDALMNYKVNNKKNKETNVTDIEIN